MTKDEIKQRYSMRDVLYRYGLIPNRAGFIACPFHREKTASMKIYKDSYYCFGCGAAGDIFGFVQSMDGVTFKEAFQSLGGTYDKPTFSSRLAVYKAEKRREMRLKEREKKRGQEELNNSLIKIYRLCLGRSEPLSEAWCDCYNALQAQLYLHGELHGIPY